MENEEIKLHQGGTDIWTDLIEGKIKEGKLVEPYHPEPLSQRQGTAHFAGRRYRYNTKNADQPVNGTSLKPPTISEREKVLKALGISPEEDANSRKDLMATYYRLKNNTSGKPQEPIDQSAI